ncbi:MAG: branched-chain amino acid ABC transporter substrate-binding protein, partial [Mycobacterium sp.]|nr:branched-chain amino acid ABC transporter substrate-binding protein [Mycobacterium sp.]
MRVSRTWKLIAAATAGVVALGTAGCSRQAEPAEAVGVTDLKIVEQVQIGQD